MWRQKLLKLLPPIIIFFSATQLGAHFWPVSSLVYGIRVDYLAPTLYFLDLIILLYLIISSSFLVIFKSLTPVLPLLLTNLLYSQNPPSTLSWSIHLLMYLAFVISIPPRQLLTASSQLLPITILFQTSLALVQFLLGHSIGGWLYYLGERTVSVGAPGIATGTYLGQAVLRAYGTFSHPNILAGYLVISYLILRKIKHKTIIDYWFLIITALGIILTQSRSAALAFFGLIVPFSLLRTLRSRLIYFVIMLFLIIGSWLLIIPTRSDLSLKERLSLQQVSLQVIQHYPIFGTGANASISTYPTIAPNFRLLQPDHNSFTLLLSWFGLFGILAIIYSLRSRLITYSLFLIPIVPLLALDHYLLTSPQGLFILLLYFYVLFHSDGPNRQWCGD